VIFSRVLGRLESWSRRKSVWANGLLSGVVFRNVTMKWRERRWRSVDMLIGPKEEAG
jgi:hypothetical protein